MKIKLLLGLVILATGISSCVSNKKYKALQDELANAQSMLDAQKKKVSDCESSKMDLEKQISKLQGDLSSSKGEASKYQAQVSELEKMKAMKEQEIQKIKDEIRKAFAGINVQGVTISQTGEKLFVSLPDQVLYKKGSAIINSNGNKILKGLADVFNANPNMNVMVEGHTDKTLVKDGAPFKDNLELSTERANNAVRFLLKNKVKPEQLTAAGRSSFEPSGKMKEGKDKMAYDRRLQIILTPDVAKLYEISKKLVP
ncbi:MAG: OmpA family protein [Saprospiraceae bacterium]|nr:OmpA family protein [Saprospiraceae bacterium]HMW37847.1 OmpA family protein [Saprospiraceae bacterium]HMX87533.1 OmpA family protein [Saprospiraceae bacterium]HMZ39589.1 OmpA family protein [Saprospiraceae bacterium]HNA63959.1 OmpA family protein [Saprospiraceae bacterium]